MMNCAQLLTSLINALTGQNFVLSFQIPGIHLEEFLERTADRSYRPQSVVERTFPHGMLRDVWLVTVRFHSEGAESSVKTVLKDIKSRYDEREVPPDQWYKTVNLIQVRDPRKTSFTDTRQLPRYFLRGDEDFVFSVSFSEDIYRLDAKTKKLYRRKQRPTGF